MWNTYVCVCAQLCPTLCNPMDCSLPGFSIQGIFQTRILEWVAIPFSRGSSWLSGQTCVSCFYSTGRWTLYHWAPWEAHFTQWKLVKSLSHVQLFVTPWTVAHLALLSMGFSRQEYWSGLPFPSPGNLPDPGIEPRSPTLRADALTSEPPGKPS